MLDVKSLTKGFLTPRLTTIQRNAISSTATGLLIFDTNLNSFYYYNGSNWIDLTSGSASGPYWSYNSPNIYMTSASDNLGLGTSAPLHKLHLMHYVSTTDGTDGNYIDIQNTNTSYGAMSGFRFCNGTTVNTFKGGIFYKDRLANGRGDLIFANNPVNSGTNVTADDARMIIKNEGNIEVRALSGVAENKAIFNVCNSDGDTVFAVYPQGVRVYVADDPALKAPGSRSGFAVGGFSLSKGLTCEYLRITPDSVRVYIEEGDGAKAGAKGGFAVGGFSLSKGLTDQFLRVTDDSTRIWTDGASGFEVRDLETSSSNYLDLNPLNYSIGHYCGTNLTNGSYNTFLGYQAGYSTTGGTEIQPGEWEGSNNIFIGYQSGFDNTTGYKNVFMGYKSGANNSSGVKNTFVGNESGETNSTGGYNSFIGYNAGIANSTGSGNTFVGADCGFYNQTGWYNVCMGPYAGENLKDGHYNTFIGGQAGHGGGTPGSYPSAFISGDYNTALGYQAGYSNVSGNGNTFIGYKAGYYETGSNRLYIDNSNTSSPLLFGEFDNNRVGINTGTPSANLHVKQSGSGEEGFAIENDGDTDVWSWEIGSNDLNLYFNGTFVGYWDDATGNYNVSSDEQLKKDIEVYKENILSSVMKLKPVHYRLLHADEKTPKTIGFIAQDVKELFPFLVRESENGTYSMNYSDYGIISIKAIQEQQKIIEELKQENAEKTEQIDLMKSEIESIREILQSSGRNK
ncbi:MAG: tail fiber domain-containing protein [Bacteroidetes bacterium]|nr:tail fiber domain-containing protein [Bacteroidota bacterium]